VAEGQSDRVRVRAMAVRRELDAAGDALAEVGHESSGILVGAAACASRTLIAELAD
jgi:hypothetical protein